MSLEQPHVRPIQRGKRPNPTEFGQKLHLSVVDGYTYLEQTSWNNFNEGSDLEATVEDYFRKFGCYPSAILADRIYQTRRNKMLCAQLGIRLSGPPLGRRKASETDTKIKRQIDRDRGQIAPAVFGRYQNVFLSSGELAELQADFPTVWQEYIERLSEYMASTGRTYKSHAATIRRWAAEDLRKASSIPSYSCEEGESL